MRFSGKGGNSRWTGANVGVGSRVGLVSGTVAGSSGVGRSGVWGVVCPLLLEQPTIKPKMRTKNKMRFISSRYQFEDFTINEDGIFLDAE